MPTPPESGSSLPTYTGTFYPSSPPAETTNKQLLGGMESNNVGNFKSEGHGADATLEPTKRPSSTDTERPPSAQRVHQDVEDQPLRENEEELEESEPDPGVKIKDFDWDELSERYHKEIAKCEENEGALSEEFEELMNFFRIWAASGHTQETSRTFSRFQTRVCYVQNSESELEKTRNHYNNVVKAFESAMNMLSNIR